MDLSIIIPAYNVEKYVGKCLQSVSSIPSIDYEIIVVNDGSTDNTRSIVDSFRVKKNANIRIINKENGGLSSARNAGLMEAAGVYIAFLDSDDYIIPDIFAKFMLDVKRDNVDIGYADYKKRANGNLYTDKSSIARAKKFKGDKKIYTGIDYAEKAFDRKVNFINSEACFAIFKRQFLVEQGLRFQEGIYHEDTLFFFQSVIVAKKVKYYDYPFYVYVIRDNSIMTDENKAKKRAEDKIYIVQRLVEMKKQYSLNSYLWDSMIVNLYYYAVYRCGIKSYKAEIIDQCNKLTFKSRLMWFFIKVRETLFIKN